MPNWCYTQYILEGDKKDIEELHSTMEELEKMEKPLVTNGFGPAWLGCLVHKLGGDCNTVHCRGEWSDLELCQDGTLRFNTETAWNQCHEVEALIMVKFPSVKVYYFTEETGMDILATNDSEGKYFIDNVMIDDEKDGMEYFTEDAALEKLSDFFGERLTSWGRASELVEQYNDRVDESGAQCHMWVRKADID